MSPEERDRLVRVETQMATALPDIAQIKGDIRAIRETLQEAKGGWRMLLLVGGACGAAGAALVKLIPFAVR